LRQSDGAGHEDKAERNQIPIELHE